jgi:transcriptional regulator with XRE-family HTH domain
MKTTTAVALRKVREIKGCSQEYIANQLGISTRAYSKIETGQTRLTIRRLDQICSVLDVKKESVLLFDENQFLSKAPEETDVNSIKNLYERLLQEKDRQIELLKSVISQLEQAH